MGIRPDKSSESEELMDDFLKGRIDWLGGDFVRRGEAFGSQVGRGVRWFTAKCYSPRGMASLVPVQGEYPDVMLIAGEPVFYEGRADTVTNPQMIVEVLSKSTRNYDQGDKFDCYRTIPGFLEYVLVDQYQVYVKQFVKTPEGFWLLKEYGERAQKLALSSIQFEIALDEIYEGIQLSET